MSTFFTGMAVLVNPDYVRPYRLQINVVVKITQL
jgi:hypothetical protein